MLKCIFTLERTYLKSKWEIIFFHAKPVCVPLWSWNLDVCSPVSVLDAQTLVQGPLLGMTVVRGPFVWDNFCPERHLSGIYCPGKQLSGGRLSSKTYVQEDIRPGCIAYCLGRQLSGVVCSVRLLSRKTLVQDILRIVRVDSCLGAIFPGRHLSR